MELSEGFVEIQNLRDYYPGHTLPLRKPTWLKTRLPSGDGFESLNAVLSGFGIATVCSAARCPNLHECWSWGTATFMLLGEVCTRACRFCAVRKGNPRGVVDQTEPERVAAAVAAIGMRHVVLTSVDRDDLDDLGAGIFAATVRRLRQRAPDCRIEVLAPDFGGQERLIGQVIDTRPDVFGHNVETVERLAPQVRDRRASYELSLGVLATVKRLAPGISVKSGLMVGLGETDAEVMQAVRDLRDSGCDIVTVGQYLQPSRRCLPVQRFVSPNTFADYEAVARRLGFGQVLCGPLVRSSYRAAELLGCSSAEHGA